MKSGIKIIGLCLAMAVFLTYPNTAFGDLSRFIPRIIDYDGYLDVYGLSQKESVDSASGSLTTKNALVRERITLLANGFVYHPKFIRLTLSLSAGLMHDNQAGTDDINRWSTAMSNEYELRATVLPYHPYKLELFTMRTEPDTGISGPAVTTDSVVYSSGATFRYKKKPYFVNMDYIRTSTTTPNNTSDSNSYGLSATYLRQYTRNKSLDITIFADHSDSSSSDGSKTSNNYLGFSNDIKRDNLGLDTLFYYKTDDQVLEKNQINFDTLLWRQTLTAALAFNLDASLSYNLEKLSFSLDRTNTSSNTKAGSLYLTHRLFRSLVSQYNLSYSTVDSSQGNSSVLTNVLSETYMKTIPWGILSLNATAAHSHTDRTGPVSLPEQPYSGLTFPGTPPLVIPSSDVDPASISVTVKSPLPPFEKVPLIEGSNYFVDIGPTGLHRVNIVFLPNSFPATGTFDFFISYSLTRGSIISNATTLSYRSEVALFDRFLTLYYNHTSFNNSTSGDAVGQALDSVTDLFGLNAQKWGASMVLEYQKVTSGDQLSNTSRAVVEYRKRIEPSLNFFAGTTYEKTNYPQGTSAFPGPSFSETLLRSSSTVSKGFFRDIIFLSLGGNYQTRTGLNDSRSYGMDSSLRLSLGKTYVSIGANLSESESKFPTGLSEKRKFQYYYFNMRRQFF